MEGPHSVYPLSLMDIWVFSDFSYCKSCCCEHSCRRVFDFLLLCGFLCPLQTVSPGEQWPLLVLFPMVSPVSSSEADTGSAWETLAERVGPACEGLWAGQACSLPALHVGQGSCPLGASLSFQIHEMGLNHPLLERRLSKCPDSPCNSETAFKLGRSGSRHTGDFNCCLWTLHSAHGSEPLLSSRFWSRNWECHRALSLAAES